MPEFAAFIFIFILLLLSVPPKTYREAYAQGAHVVPPLGWDVQHLAAYNENVFMNGLTVFSADLALDYV